MEKIKIITITENIPNDGVQFSPYVPDDMKNKIITALLEISETAEGRQALKEAYQWNKLEVHDDSFYDPFRQVLQASGLNIEELQKR